MTVASCSGCGEGVYEGQPCGCYRRESDELRAEVESLRQRLQRADDALTRAHDALMVLAPKVLAALIAINEREAGQAEEAKEAEDDKQEPAD